MITWPPVRYRLSEDGNDVLKYADDLGTLKLPLKRGSHLFTVLDDVIMEEDALKFLMAFSFTLGRILMSGGNVSAYSIDEFMKRFEGIDPEV